ncbi:LEA type 2 family protein, partial [Escherichia coli]|uniref:NDR1/HIN1-like protein n=1 Tax=Escherichia coli TaxID=562 RepID=UPI00200F177F
STCFCGLCCTLFTFLLSIVFFLGVIVLVLWLVFRPNQAKVYVETADLQQFNLSNGSLAFSLNTSISIRNPNRRISLYYDRIEALAFYGDSRFGFTTLPPFYQGHKNTSMIYPA